MRVSPSAVASGLVAAYLAATPARGEGILRWVPAHSAAAVVIRDADATMEQVNAFLKALFPDDPNRRYDTNEVMARVLKPGTWDARRPVVLVFPKPNLDPSGIVVGFTSRLKIHEPKGKLQPRIWELRESEGGHGFGARMGEYVFISPRAETLEALLELSPKGSLAARIEDEPRRLYERSDVWLHLNLDPWRPTLRRFLAKAIMLAKMGMIGASGMTDLEANAAVLDWAIDGVQTILRQMVTIDVTLRLDEEGVTVTHVHHFVDGRSVSRYLGETRQRGGALWEGLPDEPFLFALAANWHNPLDAEFVGELLERLRKCKSLCEKISPEDLGCLSKLVCESYARPHHMNLAIQTAADGSLPLEFRSTYGVEDAEHYIETFLEMNERSRKLAGAFLFGGLDGGPRGIRIGDHRLHEIPVDWDTIDPASGPIVKRIYGDRTRLRIAAISKTRVGTVMSNRGKGIRKLLNSKSSATIGDNERVRAVSARLPKRPHVLLLVNPMRLVSVGVGMAAGMVKGGAALPSADFTFLAESSDEPLLAWSGVIGESSVRGDLYLSQQDAVRFARMVRTLKASSIPPAVSVKAPRPPEPPRAPVPAAPPRKTK